MLSTMSHLLPTLQPTMSYVVTFQLDKQDYKMRENEDCKSIELMNERNST